MATSRLCGLVPKGKNASLPLKNVSVQAQVRGFVLGLQSTLTYSNDSSDPAEVLFRFPLEKSHAVVGLTATIDGRKIKADIREKEEAKAQYDDAIASGLSAALAEEKSGDVFSIALGNLPQGKDAQIQLQLVGELGIDAEGSVRFSLPTVLKPRYTPTGASDPLASVQIGDSEGEQVKSGTVPAASWFHMTVEGADGIAQVTSPTHSITVTPNDVNQLDVRLAKELDSDLVIQVKMNEPHSPKAVVEGSVDKKGEFMSNPAVMLNFYPQFTNVEAACEFIFLVDRSGSMGGSYINSARETLVLFLKSIPEGNYFNIIGFGSSYQSLFKNTVPYDQKHLEEAIKHAQEMQADLGGTELLSPLQHIFGIKARSGYARQIFVLTDGSVSNTNACIQLMKSNIKSARCFTFGIGSGASSALVEGLARAGNGTAEFVKEGERMQPKVIRSLKRALQPAVTDVSILFQAPKEYEVLQSPISLPPIFNGEKLVSYAVFKSKKKSKNTVSCTAVLKGNMLGAKQEHKVSFTLDGSAAPPNLPVIHHLAAKALITDWEIENKDKKNIVDLSIESSVISSHTAFIAIDEESSEPVSGAMKTYDVLAESSSFMAPMAFGMALGGGGSGIRSAGLFKKKGKSSDSHFFRKRDKMYTNTLGISASMMSGPPLSARAPLSPPCGAPGGSLDPLVRQSAHTRLKTKSIPPDSLRAGPPPPSSQSFFGGQMMQGNLCSRGAPLSASAESYTTSNDTLSNLITAQQVNGSWALTSSFAQLIGKSLPELETACPIEKQGDGTTVWATILAVSFLRVKYLSQQDEWELIAMKAESWLKKQILPPEFTLAKLFEAGQKYI